MWKRLILVSNGRNFDMFTALQRLASGSRLVSVRTCWHGSRASVGGVTRAWHGLSACVHVSRARATMVREQVVRYAEAGDQFMGTFSGHDTPPRHFSGVSALAAAPVGEPPAPPV